MDSALVGTSTIPLVAPGGLEEVRCDAVFQGPGTQLVRIEVDNSGSILETNEGTMRRSWRSLLERITNTFRRG